MSLNLWVSIIM